MNLFTATMVAASILAATNGIGGKFAYNVKSQNGVVTQQAVYKVDKAGKYLSHHLMYDYQYDANNRLTQKTILSWNAATEKWENSRRLNFSYNEGNCTVEYAQWNKKTNCFSGISEKVVYGFDSTNRLTGYQNFKLNEKTNQWSMVNNIAVTVPSVDLFALE